jgi:membrane associated rhomboid family serine protease
VRRGAGVSVIVASLLFGGAYLRTIGASGAIYGILLAFGVLYPDRIVLFSFLFPMKAKYFVLITGAIVFLNSLQGGSRVSHVAHLGGMVFGFIFLKMRFPRMNLSGGISQRYRRWKADRARRKFQVYMRRRESDRDRWVH